MRWNNICEALERGPAPINTEWFHHLTKSNLQALLNIPGKFFFKTSDINISLRKKYYRFSLENIIGLEVRNSEWILEAFSYTNQTNDFQPELQPNLYGFKTVMRAFMYFKYFCNYILVKYQTSKSSYKELLCTLCPDSLVVYFFLHLLYHAESFESKLKIQCLFAPIYFGMDFLRTKIFSCIATLQWSKLGKKRFMQHYNIIHSPYSIIKLFQ